MICGTGVDIAETARIERSIERHGERFTKRIFTSAEIAYCDRFKNRAERYAARFAAKEAAVQSFARGTGWREGIRWLDVEVVHLPSGKPELVLTGRAQEIARELRVTRRSVFDFAFRPLRGGSGSDFRSRCVASGNTPENSTIYSPPWRYCVQGVPSARRRRLARRTWVRLSSVKKQATKMVVVQTKPEYPVVAKVNYLQGRVQLKLTVDGEGKVTQAHVVAGEAVLAASALKAARGWLYRPLATSAGPAGFVTIVKLKYFLSSTVAELTPRRAESDFLRQVKPPAVVMPIEDPHAGESVRLHLLVDDEGKVDDVEVSPTSSTSQAEVALAAVAVDPSAPPTGGNLASHRFLPRRGCSHERTAVDCANCRQCAAIADKS